MFFLYITTMNFTISATLVKPNAKTDATSTWQFGRLDNGWYGAKLLNGSKKLYFSTAAKMNTCIGKFIADYGYAVAVQPTTVQLSLGL